MVRLTSLDPPKASSPPVEASAPGPTASAQEDLHLDTGASAELGSWSDALDAKLEPFLSSESIDQLKEMYLQGPDPPPSSTGGASGSQGDNSQADISLEKSVEDPHQGRGRGRGRGGRGGRGSRGARRGGHVEDTRRVASKASPHS